MFVPPRPGRAVSVAVVVLALAAARSPAIADLVQSDPALTAGLLSVDLAAPAPEIRQSDFDRYRSREDISHAIGRLVRPTVGGLEAVPGVNLFLIPATPFTAWFAALSIANGRGDRDAVATIDHDLLASNLHRATTDGYGEFTFEFLPPGAYYLFAEANLTYGPAIPVEHVERGWDPNGRGADVTVPEIDIPKGHVANLIYLYGYRFTDDRRPWVLGIVRPDRVFDDGKAVPPK